MTANLVLGTGVGKHTIETWLAARPHVHRELSSAGAHLIVFEVRGAPATPESWNDLVRRAMAEAGADLGAVTLPLYVASVGLHALRAAGVVAFDEHRAPPASVPAPERGRFLGYFAVGEGGAAFVTAGGELGRDPEAVVLGALR